MISFQIISNAIRWVADNWNWLQYIVIFGLSVMALYFSKVAMTAIKAAIDIAKNWLKTNFYLLIIAGIIMFLILIWNKFRDGAINACQAIGTALLVLAIGLLILGVVVHSTFLIWVALILFVAMVIFATLEYILAIIYSAVSVIWNLIVTLVISIIKRAILPLTTAWDNFANFFGNLFNDPIAAIIRSFETLAKAVLGILQTIAGGIDAIFGSNLSSIVQGWVNKVSGKADELVDRYGNGSYEQKSDVTGKVNEVLNSIQTTISWNTSDAWNTGKSHGTTAKNWLNNLGSKLQNSDSGSLLDKLGEKLGLDFSDLASFPSATDPNYDLSGLGTDPSKSLGNIDDNTSKMADSMDLTSEDVEYLRKIAALEWKKEYTIADIKVDMSNYNTINNDNDLDGIITKLTDKLYEELHEVADGVYAY